VKPYPDLSGEEAGLAVRKLRKNVDVAMVTQTILEPGGGREKVINTGFSVSFDHVACHRGESRDGTLEAFVDMSRADQLSVATNKVKFFASKAERLSAEIAGLERRMSEFKSANFDRLPESAQANVTIRGRLEQEIDTVDREIRSLQQNRVFVAQQLRQAQAGPSAGNLRQLEDEYARKSAVYAETHPDMVSLRRQIENLKRGGSVATGNTLQAQLEQQQAVLVEARQRYSDDHPDVRRVVRNIESLQARIAAGEGSPGRVERYADVRAVADSAQFHGYADRWVAGPQRHDSGPARSAGRTVGLYARGRARVSGDYARTGHSARAIQSDDCQAPGR
jgi:polysaccharide biosynthesis transport protein